MVERIDSPIGSQDSGEFLTSYSREQTDLLPISSRQQISELRHNRQGRPGVVALRKMNKSAWVARSTCRWGLGAYTFRKPMKRRLVPETEESDNE